MKDQNGAICRCARGLGAVGVAATLSSAALAADWAWEDDPISDPFLLNPAGFSSGVGTTGWTWAAPASSQSTAPPGSGQGRSFPSSKGI